MGELNVDLKDQRTNEEAKSEQIKPGQRLNWETPKIEDVSEQVMAQPYIRFT